MIQFRWDHLECHGKLPAGMDLLVKKLLGQLQQITLRHALSGADVSVNIVAVVLNPNPRVND